MGNLLVALGAIGLWESTIGNAGIAWLFSRRRRARVATEAVPFPDRAMKIDFLIPAHNEERLIQQTLTSLENARKLFLLKHRSDHHPEFKIQIQVGLDHCTDRTELVVQNWAAAHSAKVGTQKSTATAGKWNMLQQLVRSSQADWVALIDAGSAWEEGLLSAVFPHLLDSQVIGIAPSYRAVKSGMLDRLNWSLERVLKSLESGAGGPVSVHGATVFYRRETLLEALEVLRGEVWLNDDVVIPLLLRTLHPDKNIVYLQAQGREAWIRDYGIRSARSVEYGRRKRMLLGNLQWIRSFYLRSWKADPVVGLLASRRVFRTFWAYWVLLIALGAGLHLLHASSLDIPAVAGLFGVALLYALFLALFPAKGSFQRLRSAFLAGLELPYHWMMAARRPQENLWN